MCSICNEELDVYNDENLKTLYEKYREVHDIISLEDIREICLKYDIGKRVLSVMLGWGEVTFSRYYDGYLPTKQYSDVLKKIHDDPKAYQKLLEKNKSVISTVAYNKSKKAITNIIFTEMDKALKIMKVASERVPNSVEFE